MIVWYTMRGKFVPRQEPAVTSQIQWWKVLVDKDDTIIN